MSIKSDNINAIFNQFSSTNLPSFVNDFFIHSDVVLRAIDDGKMDEIYKFDDQHQYIINLNYRVLEKPKYIYSNGAESIKYYAFKNDLTLRPMGIANPLWYFAFAHNILLAHDDWLMPFYADGDGYKTVTNHSDSPILGQDLTVFSRMDYDLKKTVNLNILHGFRNEVQTKSNDVYKYNQIRNITDEGEHPFYMKLDVESYYQNIYTHQLDKLADLPPFTGNVTVGMCRPLLTFLDVFNMRISGNQTKGILQGPFSSQFSAELLGLALDSAIQTILNSRPELKEITFKRFVDDFTFYGDNQAALSLALVQIDRIFRSFGLNRKVEKTKIGRGFPAIKGGNFDDPIFNEKKGSIFGEAAVLTMNNVVDLRKKIGTLIDENNISPSLQLKCNTQ
ncbi:RNA-directed DNA polymerase [Loigolactobacillus zhaoyuanensis]|uniref:RNA-directed DNA polymerase n=1 Tax=Loigolactobacillus zhaoyuanensis TaxID=2486017 RepID=A0ABW8UIZ2_9LACO